jgi:CSLREA domain-containing protein
MQRPRILRILAPLAVFAVTLAAGAADQAQAGTNTYVVDTTSDNNTLTACTGADNDCSLRGAIIRANAGATPGDAIIFDAADFPAGAPATISISSALTTLSGGNDTIDASGRGVIIDAVNVEPAPAAFACLLVSSDFNAIIGLQITDCLLGIHIDLGADSNGIESNVAYDNNTGVHIQGNSNRVTGNKIGTTPLGDAVHLGGPNNTGVSLTGDGNEVGGLLANVISGNTGDGINIQPSADLSVVVGNLIGTNLAGTVDLGNNINGINNLGTNTTIGGDTMAERNLISGNGSAGIRISGAAATGNVVLHNFIGTDTTGFSDLGNGEGIVINDAPGNCIGGTFNGAQCIAITNGNSFISGNDGAGVRLSGAGATGNFILRAFIGLDADNGPLGNSSHGIHVASNASNNSIGYQVGEGNRIAHNGGDGIFVESGTGTIIADNDIFENGGIGIDLGPNGVTPNDPDDVDSGANGLQNFPVLSAVTNNGTGVTVQGTFNGVPNTEINIEYFSSASCDPSGNGEGEVTIGYGGGVTDANGDLVLNDSLPGEVGAFRYITATAAPDPPPFHTSEFSACIQLPPLIVNSAADPGDGTCTPANCTLREAITAANADPAFSTIHFAIGSGPQTILPGEGMSVANPVRINGTTQPGFAGTPLIEISGANAEEGSSGLSLIAPGNIVEGLVINGFDEDGIRIGSQANVIRSNYLGTDVAGTGGLGNGRSGVYVSSANNLIGGDSAADRNVISGNDQEGVQLDGANAQNNVVKGNHIGTNVAGTAAIPNGLAGIAITAGADNNVVGGTTAAERNVISGNNVHGVTITGSGTTLNRVTGNYIGTNASGTAALGNSSAGVQVAAGAGGTIIGGTTAGERNVISGNGQIGVELTGSPTNANAVRGNYIGTNAAGTGDISVQDGVVVSAGAVLNTIGGTLAGAGNVISGNDNGIQILGSTTGGVSIQGNLIGTTAAGTAPIPNLRGISIIDSAGSQIGGTTAAARNVISGNQAMGIEIQNASATGHVISGNYIGTDITGMSEIGNGGYGVLVVGGTNNTIGGTTTAARNVISGTGPNQFGAPGYGIFLNSDSNLIRNNFIGTGADGLKPMGNDSDGIHIGGRSANSIGGSPGFANTIAFNGGAGVHIQSITPGSNTGNLVISNSIFSNSGLGIDLGTAGVTLNDEGDPDAGANGLQNFPSITGVTIAPPNVTINGLLNSKPNFVYTVEIFQSFSCDAEGFGEGMNRLGEATVTIGQFNVGGWSFNTTTAQVPPGSFLSALATGPDIFPDGTSEFGLCFTVFGDDDDDNDGYQNTAENGSPLCSGSVNDDSFDDNVVNDGCALVPQAGAFSESQFKVGTNDKDPCGADGWPSDVDNQALSFNELDIFDLTSFLGPVRRLDKNPGQTGFDSRWDLTPGRGGLGAFLNIVDITTLLGGTTGNPPMFGNTRAFGKTCPFPP